MDARRLSPQNFKWGGGGVEEEIVNVVVSLKCLRCTQPFSVDDIDHKIAGKAGSLEGYFHVECVPQKRGIKRSCSYG